MNYKFIYHVSTGIWPLKLNNVVFSHYVPQKSRCYIDIHGIHYCDVIMGAMASQITSLTIVYWTVYSGVNQRQHQSSASLTFVREIHRWPMNSRHKGLVTRKMFPFDDVIMS